MKQKLSFLFFLFFIAISNSQTFSGTIGTVSDDGQANDFTVTVSGLDSNQLNASLGLVQVCLNISHTYDSDLNVFLIAPDGTTVNLFSGIGGGNDNFTDTCLNQSSTNLINTATAPFTGTFKPQETLGNCNNGQNGNGVWKLRIIDTYAQDIGIVNNWSISFGSNAATPFVFTSSNLPIVIINTGGAPISNEPPINATMGIIDHGTGNLNVATDTPNNFNGNISIEFRGAYSQSLPQKPYKIETQDSENAELNVSLLGMPEEHDWNLIANYNDKVFMRNKLAYDLFTDMGHYAARSQYCEVVVNGIYQGIYLLMESIKRDHNRVVIAKLETTENSGIDLTGGYIIKNDYWDDSNSWLTNFHPIDHPELDVHLVYDYPKPDNITPQQKSYIEDFINQFETVLYSPNYADPINGYTKYIDVNSFIDYLIVNELARNNDGFKKSSYFHKDKDSATAIAKLNAGPVWDFDWAWKNINECSIFSATDGSGWAHHINDCAPDVNSSGWYVRLMQDPNFENQFRCRWETLRTTILSNAALNNDIDTYANYLSEAQSRHFEKWGNLGVNTGAPEIEADPATFEDQITKFKNWITLRLVWLDANIPGVANNCNLSVNPVRQEENFILYPNPANEHLHFQNHTNLPESIEIFDASGKSIYRTNLITSDISINVARFANGIYYCKIYQSNVQMSVQKIVIMH
ncbi:CotH kinase family protein [Flavobacterium sp.]|uniref:CotH kinase family protein n=1 Tax=Flavobacterium sp. TaxID=239 RepID=UPI00286ABE2B|nr:CotH kinase family protein [Flavobacterium sp.]